MTIGYRSLSLLVLPLFLFSLLAGCSPQRSDCGRCWEENRNCFSCCDHVCPEEQSCTEDQECEKFCYEKGNQGVISFTARCNGQKCECICEGGMCD